MKWTDSAAWTLGVACQLRYHIRQHSNWTMTVYHRICLISLFITAGAYAKITNATIGCIKNWSQTSSYQSRQHSSLPFCLPRDDGGGGGGFFHASAISRPALLPRRRRALKIGSDLKTISGWHKFCRSTQCFLSRHVACPSTGAFVAFECRRRQRRRRRSVFPGSAKAAICQVYVTSESAPTKSKVRYDTRCYFNVRSKADMSHLNLPAARKRELKSAKQKN